MKKLRNERANRILFYALAVLFAAVLFLAVLLHFEYVKNSFLNFLSAIKPVLYAIVIVFCVNGMVNMYQSFFSRFLYKGKKSRAACKILSVTFGYFTLLMILAALLIIVFLPLVKSYSEVLPNIPAYIANAKEWIRSTIDSVPILSGESDKIMGYIDESLNLSYDSISKYAPVVMEYLNKILSEASNMLLGLIISIYIVCSLDFINRVRRRLVHAFLTEDKAHKVHDFLISVYGYFADFFSGRLLYSLIIGIVFYIVLWIMDVPLYSFISIMIGVLVFVPVIGTVVAFGISFFLVFITSYRLALWFAVVFTVVLLFGYIFLQKYIIKESVRASITASVISVLVIQGFFGHGGAVIAVPLYLTVRLATVNILSARERKNSEKTKTDGEDEEDYLSDE